ncbi:hypothetical protein [Chitinophaga niabensis]|uniref:Uncharacterized protein n=1 Tax=Chitinophaga niabensis TaxID=536979 RepID=A0A1N6JYH9_9BACT|nr:hypothetical protein [Chitinophaga niabensis]SIO49394.1 hypothetical protein SAMN04488055_4705 [Chitinophaga niabensis]
MLFQLSQQNFPDSIHSSVIPEEHLGIKLSGHTADVTIASCCTLIHQTTEERGYSLWVNTFFIHKPLILHVIPDDPIYTLYYSVENTAKFLSFDKVTVLAPEEFCILELAPCYHYGIFSAGTYRSLHLTVDDQHRSILKNQDYVAALLREHYFDIAF